MAHAEFGGAPSPSNMFGTGVSVGTHAVLLALVLLYGVTHAPGPGETAAIAIEQFNREFLKGSRPGGGRPGGGGEPTPSPPRRVESLPAPRPEISAKPNPVDVPTPLLSIPVATVDATRTLPGGVAPLDTTAPGKGSGPGGGAGNGSGSGDRDGPGLGAGAHDGAGGNAYDVGNGVTPPELIREVKPGYTIEAMRAKVQGVVELDVVVLADGTIDPRRIRIARSLDSTFGLDGQAIAAVKQWRFRPGTYKNQPVAVRVRVELTFTLR